MKIICLLISLIYLSLEVSAKLPVTTVSPADCQPIFNRWKLKLKKNLTMNAQLMLPKVAIDPAVVFCRSLFVQWKLQFNKTFSSFIEDQLALSNFLAEYDKAERHNAKFEKGQVSYKMRTNLRSEFGLKEKRTYLTGFTLPTAKNRLTMEKNLLKKWTPTVAGRAAPEPQPIFPAAPASLDYRNNGYVTEVVDQGFLCSSCYAFSAQAAIEGARAKKYGVLEKLSEQEIIDCNYNPITGNWGCDGGWMGAVFEYVIRTNGTESAKAYPLQEERYSCRFNSSKVAASVVSYGYIQGNEETLKRALAYIGVLSVAVDSQLESFYNYWSGVYDDPQCSTQINHAMTLVGYATDYSYNPPKDYWLLKNSWGTSWGENGYMRLQRGVNRCGITGYVAYPIV